MTKPVLSRRFFLKASVAVGGGLILGFHMPDALAASIGARPQSTTTASGTEINAWLVIDKDGTVTIRIPHTEMGQGGITSVAMLIAEELNVNWSKIKTEFVDANRHLRNNKEYKVMTTHGSQLVRLQHPHLMGAGASARERLKQAAAEAWGVDRSQVEAKLGMLTAGSRSGTYGEFAEAAAKVVLDKEPEIQTDPAKWWLLGKPRQRLDIPHKVNGSAQFAIDTRLPGMVYAAVKASPVPWGTLKSYNFDAIKGRPGVIAAVQLKAVPGKRAQPDLQDAVAVVADTWYRAKTALDLLPIEWDFGDSAKASTADYYAQGHKLMEQKGLVSGKEDPQAAEIIAAARKVVTASYERPFETHARMEPINATVHVQVDRVDVWSPTQDQSAAITLVADQLKVDPKTVYAHTMFLGGGFGGNGPGGTGVTRQAAEIAKQVGKPVQVIWSREEDIAQDKQRPLAVAKLSAAIGNDGLPTALFTRAAWFTQDGIDRVGGATADYGIYNVPYKIPHRHHERHNAKTSHPELDPSRSRRQPARFHGRELRRRDGDRGRLGSARMAPQDDRGFARLATRAQDAQGEGGFPDRPAEGRRHGRRGRRIARHHRRGLRHGHGQPARPARDREGPGGIGCGSRHQSACRRRAVRRLGLLGALACLDGRARAGERPFRQHQLRHLQPAAHPSAPAGRDHLRIVRRQEMGWSRRARRPARASRRRQRALLRHRQAHPRDAVSQPGSDLA